MDWELNAENARTALGDSNTPATVLHTIILKAYGTSYVYGDDDQDPVDPVILWQDLEDDFRISIPVEVENKVNAIITACSTDYFFTEPDVFSSICVAIATGDLGDEVNGEFDSPTVHEMFCAIQEVDLNDGDREVTFSPAVRNYIKNILDNENVDTEEEVDQYAQDSEEYLLKVAIGLESIGVPESLLEFPESDLYGLLGN